MSNRRRVNLNDLTIHDHTWDDRTGTHDRELPLKDNNISVPSVDASVYFRNIKSHLINHIIESDIIVGCVAWFTDFDILDVLASKWVSIVVQKEDFLRFDRVWYKADDAFEREKEEGTWKAQLREKYNALRFPLYRFEMPGLIGNLSVAASPDIAPVRCMGSHNAEKLPASPRMHNKFLIFCRAKRTGAQLSNEEDSITEVQPYAAWTGSFNFSYNANFSFENAVVIYDEDVAWAYYREYAQILALSEPLDWEKAWVYPEWRIGT